MTFCTIIPDRGDRPEFTSHCLAQLERMTVKPDKVFHINERPSSEGFDLVHRVKVGFNLAKAEGMEWCFIIENDDFYPANYFERFLPYMEKFDFIGEEKTIYYNLRNLTHRTINHNHRSSLFTTAFRVSALNNYEWPSNNTVFLDLHLWKECARHKRRKFIETGAIGIKHGTGLCGGKGHTFKSGNTDNQMRWLERSTDEHSFNFYKGMVEQFNKKAA